MPISSKHKIIFVHIPKTAGTSIEYLLDMHGCKKDIGINRYLDQEPDFEHLFGSGLQHLSAKEIEKIIGQKIFKEYFKFSIIRNPYDRLISYFAWLDGKWVNNKMLTKENFYKYLNEYRLLNYIPFYNNFPKPQYKYLYIKKKLAVDFIIRYERLEEGIKEISSKIGLNINLPLRMKSFHMNYREYYNFNTVNIVRRLYYKDFKLFNYNLEL